MNAQKNNLKKKKTKEVITAVTEIGYPSHQKPVDYRTK